jgi:peptidoglycan hydrolase-like protein with peptidoglycan-binding domain
MLPNRVTLQLLAFLLLSGGVAANVFYLQSRGRGTETAQVGESTAWNIAALETAETAGFGDTGSIGQVASERPNPLNVLNLSALAAAAKTSKVASQTEVTRAVQRELQIRGYETGARDGVAGVMTRGAIMAFEYDHGLPLTARASQELLKAIILGEGGKASSTKGAKAETAEAQDVTRSVQRSLVKLGYKAGVPNGKLTPETARAIRAFEGDQALPETGRVSGPLISRLARLSGEGRVAATP